MIEFLDELPSEETARIAACLSNIEKLGFDSPRVQFRQIKGSLWEIKIKTHRSGYRLFYVCIQGNNIVLLHDYPQTEKGKLEVNRTVANVYAYQIRLRNNLRTP